MLDGLNKEQKLAVISGSKHQLIIAGPGTGKTHTLTHKIAYLINSGTKPQQIVALTFTKKAAAQLKERLGKILNGNPTQLPFIGTFHSFSKKVIENENKIKIIDEKSRIELIKELSKKRNYKDLMNKISTYKLARKRSRAKNELRTIVKHYDAYLKDKGLIDYDDLLILAFKKIKDGDIKFKHVLVDELQDTNKMQYLIIKQLIAKTGKIFAIGDPKQSIYGFRGAYPDIFDRFKKDFKNTSVIKLSKNYRSAKQVIKVYTSLFPRSDHLTANTDSHGRVFLVNTFNQYSEADFIRDSISQKVGGFDLEDAGIIYSEQKEGFNDIAIIYRVHSLRSTIVNKLERSGLPYQIVGGGSFLQKKDIKKLIDALRIIHSKPGSDKDKATVPKLGTMQKKRGKYAEIKLGKLFYKIAEDLDIDSKQLGRDIKNLVNMAYQFEKDKDPAGSFLNYLDYLEDKEFYDDRANKITLLTIHAAKGLEFKYVYLIGFEENLVPYTKGDSDINEEKRLLYVALSRAEKEVYLFETIKRFGKSHPSRFKKDIIKNTEAIQDPAIERIIKRIEKNKRRQLGLF